MASAAEPQFQSANPREQSRNLQDSTSSPFSTYRGGLLLEELELLPLGRSPHGPSGKLVDNKDISGETVKQ